MWICFAFGVFVLSSPGLPLKSGWLQISINMNVSVWFMFVGLVEDRVYHCVSTYACWDRLKPPATLRRFTEVGNIFKLLLLFKTKFELCLFYLLVKLNLPGIVFSDRTYSNTLAEPHKALVAKSFWIQHHCSHLYSCQAVKLVSPHSRRH